MLLLENMELDVITLTAIYYESKLVLLFTSNEYAKIRVT